MSERYSSGSRAKVYLVEEFERMLFPHAQLARFERNSDRHWFSQLYYKHKIASLLFPDRFINVVAAITDPLTETLSEGEEQLTTLFSEQASVPDNHAIYSSHMSLVAVYYTAVKQSTCGCSGCSEHRQFHLDNSLAELAKDFARQTCEAGINIGWKDPSDYCLTPQGLIFFEIGDIDEEKMKVFLGNTQANISAQILAYLDRI